MNIDVQTLRQIRAVSSLTIEGMAARIGVSARHLKGVLNGERRLADSLRRKVVAAFGLNEEKIALVHLACDSLSKEVRHA